MLDILKQSLRCNPEVFFTYHSLVTGHSKRIRPDRNTDLVVTSWGRSGTTFVRNCIRRANPNLRLATHGHTLATIRSVERLGCPCVVTFREPEECISSAAVALASRKKGLSSRQLAMLIRDYVCYHKGVLLADAPLALLEFKELTARPALIFGCCRDLGVPIGEVDLDSLVDATLREIETQSAYMPLAESGLSNETKNCLKKEMRPQLESMPHFQYARSVYDTLHERRWSGVPEPASPVIATGSLRVLSLTSKQQI